MEIMLWNPRLLLPQQVQLRQLCLQYVRSLKSREERPDRELERQQAIALETSPKLIAMRGDRITGFVWFKKTREGFRFGHLHVDQRLRENERLEIQRKLVESMHQKSVEKKFRQFVYEHPVPWEEAAIRSNAKEGWVVKNIRLNKFESHAIVRFGRQRNPRHRKIVQFKPREK